LQTRKIKPAKEPVLFPAEHAGNYISIGLLRDDALKLATTICPKGLSYLSSPRKRAGHGARFSIGHLAGKTNPNRVST